MPIQGVRFLEEQAKTANAKLAILLRLPWRHHSPSALTSLSMLPLTLYCLQALIFKKSINEKERKRVLRERKICKKKLYQTLLFLLFPWFLVFSQRNRRSYHSISIVIKDLDISLPWSIVFFNYSDAVVWEDAFLWYDFLLVSWSPGWRHFYWHHVVSSFDRPSWTPSDCKQTIAAACSAAFLLHSLKQHNNNTSIITGRGEFSKKTCCVQIKPAIQTSIWILTARINYNKSVKGGKFLKKLWCCVGGSIAR